jgi:predicted HTH transcriptional regulator
MTDAERIEALLDLVDPARAATVNRGRELAVLGLAEPTTKGGYRPTNAGWVLMGDRGRAFQPN